MAIPEKFLKPYSPDEIEGKIYEMWESSGYFNPDNCIKDGFCDKDAEHFSIVLPPPNVTGTLHLGHALENSIQDTFVRFHRMLRERTLWVPGTDHAAIATQSKVEKQISNKEKKSRHDLGREELLKRVEQFAQESRDTIVSQVRGMGSSLDWSREAFTLDDVRVKAVQTIFKEMYEAGLLFRKERVVNWDPKGQTTISDDEVVHEERDAMLYTFKYSSDFPITISTTRPETKLGDTAVAVHPDDTRYKEYIGKEYTMNFMGTKITVRVVGDEHVDPEFGTGALGVTPAHSQADAEIAERHNLLSVQIINEYAKMMVGDEDIKDKKTTVAREVIVEKLRNQGLMEKEEKTTQNISLAERTNGVIEPLPKMQWWVDTNKEFEIKHSEIEGIKDGDKITLKYLMKHVVESKQIDVLPERFERVYYNWIDNLRPWCISRQIWYGHRIPAWYKDNEIFVGAGAHKGDGWIQDEDTLDTWFSSGLWTFSTLGWPDMDGDMANYHPTTLMAPGYELIFFWVARMILMTGFAVGQIPFKTVYLHGLLRAKDGRKFSKSLNNGIDPLDMIAQYGADALRFALVIGTTAGNDMKFDEQQVNAYKKFTNKLWNISRFILTETENTKPESRPVLTKADEKIISDLNGIVQFMTEHLEKHRSDLAADKIYHYIWHELADKILEESKPVLSDGSDEEKTSRAWVLYEILTTSLKLLHPFMPFVTEEIWQELPQKECDILMVAKWPKV